MADVYAVFGTLLALGIAFPGMLTAWWLIFPGMIQKASTRLERSPWKSLALGGLLAVPLAIVLLIVFASPFGRAKFIGALLLFSTLGFASLGASGLAALMGRRLAAQDSGGSSPLARFVRGALALELAAVFPVIGWLLVVPSVTLASLGAATFALLGWMPSGAGLYDEPTGEPGEPDSAPQDEPALGQAGA